MAARRTIAAKHHDTDHGHVHIIASRIAAYGSVGLGRHDVRQAMQATEALEEANGLQRTRAYSPEVANRQRQPCKVEIELALRTKQQPPRMQLQPNTAEHQHRHPSTKRANHSEMGATPTTEPSRPMTGHRQQKGANREKELER